MASQLTSADAPLPVRYTDAARAVFDDDERARFLDGAGRARHPDELPWELLYRIEPQLYARLVAGERLHQGILEWLPQRLGDVLEVGAGTGRLTLELARRSDRLVAVEPAAGLRTVLERRLRDADAGNVSVARGFFDTLPQREGGFDMVVSCSAFAADTLADPDRCLAAMESCCAPGGLVVLVWPGDVPWLQERDYEHVVFEGPMLVEFASCEDAISLARIFYPHAVARVAEMGSRFVDFTTLGITAPRDLCWKRRRDP